MNCSKLMSSTILVSVAMAASAAFAQDNSAAKPQYSLTLTGGIAAVGVPSFGTGIFGHSAPGNFLGLTFGGGISSQVGKVGDWDLLLGASGTATLAGGSSSYTDEFTGADSGVLIRGTSTPSTPAAIITTHGAGTATVLATGAGGATANTTAAGATNNVAAVSPDGAGFVMSSVVTGAATGASYGGIGATSGGVFLATGDIDGLTVTTNVSRSFIYGGADLTIGLGRNLDENTQVQFYGGPSFRGLAQGVTTEVDVNIPELQPSVLTHPDYKMTTTDSLLSGYYGAVLGGAASFQIQPGVIFTLGAEGGLYDVQATWNGRDTYSTCCGSIGTPLATNSPTISVQGPANTYNFGSTIAFAARGNGSVTFAVAPNRSITLGSNIEYLSGVATVNHSGLTQTGHGDTWTPAEGNPSATTFGWSSMINYGLTASFTGHF